MALLSLLQFCYFKSIIYLCKKINAMKTRLQYIVKSEGLTNQKFASEIGVSPAAVTHILSGRNNPSLEIISKIALRYPHYSLRWLILGELPIILPDNPAGGTTDESTLPQYAPSPTLPFEEANSDTHQSIYSAHATPTNSEETSSNVTEMISTQNRANIDEYKCSVDKLIVCFPDGTFKEYNRQ